MIPRPASNNIAAFPGSRLVGNPFNAHEKVEFNQGMTLRDYAAVKAMHALMAPGMLPDNHPDKIAEAAYKQADAMLRARQP